MEMLKLLCGSVTQKIGGCLAASMWPLPCAAGLTMLPARVSQPTTRSLTFPTLHGFCIFRKANLSDHYQPSEDEGVADSQQGCGAISRLCVSKPAVNCGLCCTSRVMSQKAEAYEPHSIFLAVGVPRCVAGTHTGSVVKHSQWHWKHE